MEGNLDLLIYLDEFVIRNLSSAFFSGYIDIRTYREVEDKYISGKVHGENRDQCYEEDRFSKDLREGYKGKNNTEVQTLQNSSENDTSLETSNSKRCENEIKTIYTSFSLHNELISGLSDRKMLREINAIENNIIVGEYVKIAGDITTISIVSYIEILINILNCYGISELNSLIENNGPCILDYGKLLNMLIHLLDLLTKNGTQDLLIKLDDLSIILTVNVNNFLNGNASMFDKVNCSCKLIGKVMSISNKKDKISLLRKTAQFEYYENLLVSFKPLLAILEKEGVILPIMPQLSINDNYVVITPISIYI